MSKKGVLSLLLVFLMVAMMPVNIVLADNDDKIEEEGKLVQEKKVTIQTGLDDKTFKKELNKIIDDNDAELISIIKAISDDEEISQYTVVYKGSIPSLEESKSIVKFKTEKEIEEDKVEVIKEVQKRVLKENIQLKLEVKKYKNEPVPVDLISGARFMVNDRYYAQDYNFLFEEKYNYINRLENGKNFIRLRYNPENGLLNIYCDDTQPYCNINESKSSISQITGYLLVDGYELSLVDSDLNGDVPNLVYKASKNPADSQYIELGVKNKLTFKMLKSDGSPMREDEISDVYYSCPDELKLPPVYKDELYTSVYNEKRGELTLYTPMNQECIVLSATSNAYRDSEKNIENGDITFLDNYYTVMLYLKTDTGFQLRNDLVQEIYVVDKNEKKQLIPNRNRWVTERYTEGTRLPLYIKIKEGYNTINTDYYAGYDANTDTIKKDIVIDKFTNVDNYQSDEEIEENTLRIAISETSAKVFQDKHGSTIKKIIIGIIIAIIIIIIIAFLRSDFLRKIKMNDEERRRREAEEYERMFNKKADWED